MSLEQSSQALPILGLLSDVLFPATQLTIHVPKSLNAPISQLLRSTDSSTPLIVAVPAIELSPTALLSETKLHNFGCIGRIIRFSRPSVLQPNQCTLTLAGVARVQLETPVPHGEMLEKLPTHPIHYQPASSKYSPIPEPAAEAFRDCALKLIERQEADSKGRSRLDWRRVKQVTEEADLERLPWVADILMAITNNVSWQEKLNFLSAFSPDERLRLAASVFSKQVTIAEMSQKITSAVDESLSKQQKEFYLRQQLQAIQKELASLKRPTRGSPATSTPTSNDSGASTSTKDGSTEADEFEDDGDDASYFAELQQKIQLMEKESDERKMAVRELKRLKRIPGGSVEYGVIRTYLDWLTGLPWPNNASDVAPAHAIEVLKDPKFLSNARAVLDGDHFGLDNIKRRLIEHLAVIRLKALKNLESGSAANPEGQKPTQSRSRTKGPILLLVGPPGCGKTSIASSLARALDRPFQRISLGGVRDEAEIRGHRRTYVASGPGSVVTALSKAKRLDPVILLDEIDKVGKGSFQGDPSAALLEVLDPEQNAHFKDHYINVPIDLSQVLFIATANSLDTVSEPLLDRCEVIQLSGYTYDEKVHIAKKFLLPKQLEANALSPKDLEITDDAFTSVASYYTREAGVRSLERCIGSIARFKAVEWAEHGQPTSGDGAYSPIVDVGDLEKILGIPRWDPLEREREERRGVVYGMVVTGSGEGGVLPVESVTTPGTGVLKLTGSLGDVIKESGEIALSWVKANAYALGITASPRDDPLKISAIDIHLHLPSGAVKKDGPSAGVAYVCAFVSLLTGLTVPATIAMTGEITLRGRVTAVGGIKEKVLGAHREGVVKIILPRANRKDVDHDIPTEIHKQIQFVFVSKLEEALEAAFGSGVYDPSRTIVESRL